MMRSNLTPSTSALALSVAHHSYGSPMSLHESLKRLYQPDKIFSKQHMIGLHKLCIVPSFESYQMP